MVLWTQQPPDRCCNLLLYLQLYHNAIAKYQFLRRPPMLLFLSKKLINHLLLLFTSMTIWILPFGDTKGEKNHCHLRSLSGCLISLLPHFWIACSHIHYVFPEFITCGFGIITIPRLCLMLLRCYKMFSCLYSNGLVKWDFHINVVSCLSIYTSAFTNKYL